MNKISTKQLQANRQNAQKGGVKTVEGKAVTRYNALKHGFYSNKNLIDGESRKVFYKFSQHIIKDLAPVGFLEQALVQKIIATLWRMRRLYSIETDEIEKHEYNQFGNEFNRTEWVLEGRTAERLSRHEGDLDRAFYKAIKELRKLQKDRQNGFVL